MALSRGLGYIEAKDGRKLTYRFTPGYVMKGAPLLVIFGAKGQVVPSKFGSPYWNILSLVDSFGLKGHTSAYLGEQGDFFVRDMVRDLIAAAIEECACVPGENLFFYASSVAAPAAIMHGILFEARAVHLNAPIVKSHGTTLYWELFKEGFDFVIPPHRQGMIEADMTAFLRAHREKKLPAIFVCDNIHQDQPGFRNFLQEHTMYFVHACLEEGVDLYLELLPGTGHVINHTLPEVVDLFLKYAPPKFPELIHVDSALEEQVVKVTCTLGKDYPEKGEEQFAFYLLHNGLKVQQQWYEANPTAEFTLKGEAQSRGLEVIVFVQDKEGFTIQKRFPLSPKRAET